jgi:hypothetical protein
MVVFKWHRHGAQFFGANIPEWFAYGLALFLVLFPKGGFKAGNIPLTWGYFLIGIVILVGTPFWILTNSSALRMSRASLGAFLSVLPIQLLFIYSLAVNGIGDFGFAVSDIVNFFVLPIAFLAIFPQYLHEIRMERFLSFVRWMVFLAAAYGIFLFFWRIATGSYIEIPFLTVNIGDVGSLDDKFNYRPGGIFKLISTYNNGNQYGVATLLLLPFLEMDERRRWQKWIVKIALALTLSRTVWIGLVLNELLAAARSVGRDLLSGSHLSIRYSSLRRIGMVMLFAIGMLGLTFLFSGVSFLLDPTLGGRADRFTTMGRISILPAQPVAEFVEIVYFTALWMLGLTGLIAIVLLFFAPLGLAALFKEVRRTPLQIAALSGLLLYIPLAGMDGALPYIPTMAFYWFLWMLLIHGGQMENSRLAYAEAGSIVHARA